MGQFIEVNHIHDDLDPYEKTTPLLLNKKLITNIEDDTAHNQIYITYEGKELRCRNKYDEIRASLLEE